MTGKATIILSDAATGAEIKRIEEHNLVTNAIRNVLNPPHFALLHGFNYSKLFEVGLPMWKTLLGGIMLLGNREEEDADNILLSDKTIPIATAGDGYAGSCTTRGSLNVNESYQTDNGYHFTWDFATDKANGSINCLCLTHRVFGNTGFSKESYSSMFSPPNALASHSSTSDMKFIKGYGQYVGTYEDGLHVFMFLTGDNTLEFRRYKGACPEALLINDVYSTDDIPEPVSVTTLPLDVTVADEHNFFLDPLEKTVYYFERSYLERDDESTTVRYSAVNFEANTCTTHTVKLQTTASYYAKGAVFGGKIYLSTVGEILEFSMDGSFIRSFGDVQYNGYNNFFVLNGQVMFYSTSYGFVLIPAWDKRILSGIGHYPQSNVSGIHAPYVAFSTFNTHGKGSVSYGNTPTLAVCTAYKATINNLAAPIVKTSDNTLKIVYDITN